MIRTPVGSSSLTSVGYDADNLILEVEFRSRKIYQYLGVPLAIHQGMMSADSLGQFLNKCIKPAYECKPL
jgi:hypothetical protein